MSESGSTTHSGVSDLIRSFGIINIVTVPTDTTITLGSGTYNTDDKRMSDYGQYHMEMIRDGYISNRLDFVIDREKPYLIEKVSLIPLPTYQKMKDIQDIYHTNEVDDDTYILKTASGLIWSGSTMRGRMSYSGSLDHIGSVYFQTNTGVVWWSNHTLLRSSDPIQDYIKTCPDTEWRLGIFYCPAVGSILTE
jgi:hypothetical protein